MTQKNTQEKQSFTSSLKKTWIVVEENLLGTENQCLGVANALGLDAEVKHFTLRSPWKQLSPFFRFWPEKSISNSQTFFSEPLPDIVIAAGRKAVMAALAIKKLSNGTTFVIFLQDPKIPSSNFDIVIAPSHDKVAGNNTIHTIVGLHNVTPAKIDEHKKMFEKKYQHLPQPRIGVLIGGNSKTHNLTEDATLKLAQNLMSLAEKGHGVMVTASRRTGKRNLEILKNILNISRVNLYTGPKDGTNPYFGILGWADILMVTEDSVSMVSEAISTGKPVYIIPMKGSSAKFERFHTSLLDTGITRIFDGKTIEKWEYTPPNDMAQLKEKILPLLGEKLKIG